MVILSIFLIDPLHVTSFLKMNVNANNINMHPLLFFHTLSVDPFECYILRLENVKFPIGLHRNALENTYVSSMLGYSTPVIQMVTFCCKYIY